MWETLNAWGPGEQTASENWKETLCAGVKLRLNRCGMGGS